MTINPLVPVIPMQRVRAWPKNEDGCRIKYVVLSEAILSRFATDAHTSAYSAPTVPRRLALDAIKADAPRERLGGGVDMVLALFDIDRHAGPVDGWWKTEKEKIAALFRTYTDGFAYRTRGGYRIVYTLEPLLLTCANDAAAWTSRYLAWCVHLKSRFNIDCDPACSEWVRLYRLPHATREGSDAPEEYETIGDPRRVGLWEPALSEFDWTVGASFKKRKEPRPRPTYGVSAGDGVLFYAFRARGWVGNELERGKWSVTCPWERQHSKGDRYNTSTILYAPGHGETLGWLKCSHAHCQGRTIAELLSQFSEMELERAKSIAGVK